MHICSIRVGETKTTRRHQKSVANDIFSVSFYFCLSVKCMQLETNYFISMVVTAKYDQIYTIPALSISTHNFLIVDFFKVAAPATKINFV